MRIQASILRVWLQNLLTSVSSGIWLFLMSSMLYFMIRILAIRRSFSESLFWESPLYNPFLVDVLPFDEIPDVIGNYDICVVKSMMLNSDIIARANKMKLIMQFAVGIEGVDIDAATKHGIKVARIPSDYTGNATSCAEMAIYLMLGLLRKQHEMQVSIKEKILGCPAGDTLLGKTYKKLWWEAGKRYVKLRLSTKALKTIEKNGLDAVAKKAEIDLRKE